MKKPRIDSSTMFFLVAVIVLSLIPTLISPFRTELLAKYLLFAVVAMGVDVLWGYTGMLTLGQAVFFGLGAYSAAWSLKFALQDRIPEFMEGALKEYSMGYGRQSIYAKYLPIHMKIFATLPAGYILAVVLPVILALFLGYFLFRGRVTGVYFAIITLLVAVIAENAFWVSQVLTGGFNGITDIPRLKVLGYTFYTNDLYYLVLVFFIGAYLFYKWLLGSHFGLILKAIKENETRAEFLSYDIATYKTMIFGITAGVCGIAGALFAPLNAYVATPFLGLVFSINLVIWVAVGGRGTLLGAVIGTVVINTLQSYLSEMYQVLWLFILGLMFIFVVLFIPDGIVGTINKLRERKAKDAS